MKITHDTCENEILGFISRFTNKGRYRQVIDAFTCGCCWWFARILAERFTEKKPVIMYDEIKNHFGTQINGHTYDITGNVTNAYSWKPWNDIDDALLKKRIIRDCIQFEE